MIAPRNRETVKSAKNARLVLRECLHSYARAFLSPQDTVWLLLLLQTLRLKLTRKTLRGHSCATANTVDAASAEDFAVAAVRL